MQDAFVSLNAMRVYHSSLAWDMNEVFFLFHLAKSTFQNPLRASNVANIWASPKVSMHSSIQVVGWTSFRVRDSSCDDLRKSRECRPILVPAQQLKPTRIWMVVSI